jgi:hypothetical protein
MVIRKPVPGASRIAGSSLSDPASPKNPQSIQENEDSEKTQQHLPEDANVWSGAGIDKAFGDDAGPNHEIPHLLIPGPPRYGSRDTTTPTSATTNPFLKQQNTSGSESLERERSASALGDFVGKPQPPTWAPPPPPKGMDCL